MEARTGYCTMKYEQNVATIDNGQCVVNQTKKMAVGATASNDHQLVRYPFRLLLDESWINDRTNLGRCFWHTCGLLLHFCDVCVCRVRFKASG